jgi:hypothetical protein
MAYENTHTAEEAINTSIGIIDNRFDGVWVPIRVTEIYLSGWRPRPTGRFQVVISSPYRRQARGNSNTILRTRKELNNEFDMAAIKAAVIEYVTVTKRQDVDDMARVETRASNKSIVEETMAMYQGKRYVSDHSSNGCAVFASEHEAGKVRLKWDFGSVDAETAAKIMKLINEIGA